MTHPRLSRRDFLGMTGLGALAAGLSCGGGVLGYLALKQLTQTDDESSIPPATTTSLARTGHQKRIERPPITLRAGWQARAPNHDAENENGFYSLTNAEGWRDYEGDLRATYNTVVIHHSVLYENDDVTTMQEIQNLHMDERQWADIGYHFGVGRTGQVFEGRDLMARGTHVEQFNTGSVGMVFFGNFELELPTIEQLEVGQSLINWLALRLELTHLAGHHDFNDFTKCPGQNMIAYLELFAGVAELKLGTSGYKPSEEQRLTPTPQA